MNIQFFQQTEESEAFALLPISIYFSLEDEITKKMKALQKRKPKYIKFVLEDYIKNPIALARIKAKLDQKELADRLGVSQEYISKLEAQARVSKKTLNDVMQVLREC